MCKGKIETWLIAFLIWVMASLTSLQHFYRKDILYIVNCYSLWRAYRDLLTSFLNHLKTVCCLLLQPVACEGQIETWLTAFLNQLKTSLQLQLATAMGVEKPLPRPRSRHEDTQANASTKPGSSVKKGECVMISASSFIYVPPLLLALTLSALRHCRQYSQCSLRGFSSEAENVG